MSEEIDYTLCDDCGVMVPDSNFEIHQARNCGGRARAADANVIDVATPPTMKRPSNSPGVFRSRQRQRIEKSDSEDDEASMDQESSSNVLDDEDDDEIQEVHDVDQIQEVHDVVDLTASPDASNEEWSCPKCTLLNPNNRPRCEACQYVNPALRAPDATRSERLIDDFGSPQPGNGSLLNVGGGALLGGLLGGAASYMRGRSVADGMMEGVVSGAVGGAIVDSMLSSPRRNPRPVTAARSGAAMGHPAYPSLSPARAPSTRQAPRASFQVRQQRRGNGRMLTTVIRSDGTTRYGGNEDPLMALMMAFGHGQNNGVDGMNYEQLLQRFGDGTENMGAEEGTIAQLPVSTISNPEKELPEDSRQCCICLDDFEKGASRKTLPCLHGFHEECIDRALRNRGCCPICNQSVK